MARKHDLRAQRAGTVIHMTSRKQETDLGRALAEVVGRITDAFNVELEHTAQWKLADIVSSLRGDFNDIKFHYHFETSAMKPDGGILSMLDDRGTARPILNSGPSKHPGPSFNAKSPFITCLGNAIRPSITICSRYLKEDHCLLTATIVLALIRADESTIQTSTSRPPHAPKRGPAL